ncbi:carbohydrate-binding protein [Flavobacterium sp. ARAG 55.4]|uniref:carbohydrate-binding protein n=1 Tax=Flavobacterium sp. ARAG 55.4 TaxID=3451357 RepID=UPI003F4607FB
MKKILQLSFFLFTTSLLAQVTHYDWPTGTGEALLSNKYRVFVKHGTDPEQEVKVLMSTADPNDLQYDYQATELTGRTFSYASISYNNIASPGVTFRIVKTFGNNSSKVKISPKSYNITPTVGNNEVSFTINSNNKYISIDFEDTTNETSTKKWIKHMLTIFVDPPETNKPNPTDAGVVVYSNNISPTALENATTIYFAPGYYNLRNYQFAGTVISSDGILYLGNDKKIYLAGGAFVEGLIDRTNYNNTNQKLYGRGVLSGRQYIWQDALGNKPYGQLVQLGKFAEINGVHLVDSPKHGIVSPDGMVVENLKFLGWHANNDGLRIGTGSEVKNSFIRAVDDFFYNYNIYVHDCVFWAGHNGAIVTYGWASIDTGSSFLENIDIINPEWSGLGNNNGLIAAQVNLDFNPIDYGTGSTTTTFKNIRIEGSIPGLTNIKPRSESNGVPVAAQVDIANLGYLGDVQLENITIEKQFDKGRIRGQANATTSGNNTYYSKNINFTNIMIGGVKLTNVNKNLYFDIDETTTQNITFDIGIPPAKSEVEVETFTNATLTQLKNNIYATGNRGIIQSDMEAIPAGTGKWFAANPLGVAGDDLQIKNTGGNPTDYVDKVSTSEFSRGIAYVYNNTNADATGVLNMSFDYFWKAPMTGDRISYRVWGVKEGISAANNAYFRMTGGSGNSGDNDAVNFVKGTGNDEVIALSSNLALGNAESWKTINYTIDVTDYKYIVIMFSSAYGTAQIQNAGLFGLDNVAVPATNPAAYDNYPSIPSLIQSENYTSANGVNSESTSDTNGGQNINLVDANSSIDYEVYVKKSDLYRVKFRVASNSNASFNLSSNGNLLKTINIENTGGLQSWKTITLDLNLTKGLQTLKINAATTGFNINWIEFLTIDDDKDGVENEIDECANTPEGTVVDEKGCPIFKLSSSNFSITSVSETCPNKANGKITIAATENYDYKTTINGIAYQFTSATPLTVANLTPGKYDFCITIDSKNYSQCYSVNITAGVTMSAKTVMNSSKASINIEEGTAPFKVFVNGNEILETMKTSFDVDINQGDLIEIKSNVECEGTISKKMYQFNEISVYPNPTKGHFIINNMPFNLDKIVIELYDSNSKLISTKSYPINYGNVELNIEDVPSGLYFVKAILNTPVYFKIIKN